MDFIGRVDPVQKLEAWLSGEGLRVPLSIVSISGPGGIGKTFLLEHAIQTASLEGRNYLRLRISGTADRRTLAQLIGHDLPQSTAQIDAVGKDRFIQTRKNLDALRVIDDEARAEVEPAVASTPELRETMIEVFRLGVGLQAALPVLKQYVDLTKVKEEHVTLVADMLEKSRAYKLEDRLLGGLFPDIRGKGRRNRLRAGQETVLADGLIADLTAILAGYKNEDRLKPMPSKVPGLDRLLLVIDDYESLAPTLTPFLSDYLVPRLARAKFETLMIVLGRDRLSDTHAAWKQQHESKLIGELRLTPFTRDEAESYIRSRGIEDGVVVSRILEETAGYPYLIAGEVESELSGGRTALGLKSFYDRTTRWMTPREKSWFTPLCFLTDINEETISVVLPEEDPGKVLEWFKSEASVRSPTAAKWEVLPIIRSRVRDYCKMDSPKRHQALSEAARSCAAVT